MARKSSGNEQSVSLFPFLAVLVCVMGSLIFLLLATTKRMHEIAVAEAAAKLHPPKPTVETPLPVLGPSSELPPEPLAASPDPEEEQRRRELQQSLQTRIDELQQRRGQMHQALQRQQVLGQSSAKQTSALQQEIHHGQTKLRGLLAEVDSLPDESSTAEDLAALEAEIIELRRKLRQLQNRPKDENSKFAVIPFDVRSGTTRRPILIECTERGLRFLPENIVVSPGDLDGFTERFNPLLTGAKTLIGYWNEHDRQSSPADQEGEPYVLLIVRPNGTIAYYIAMKMLSTLRQPFGYELVDESVTLQPPPLNVTAQAQCREAIEQQLAERSIVAQGGGGSGTGGGRGGGKKGGSGTGQGSSKQTFEVTDILPPDDGVGERSWENFDRFEGRKNRAKSSGTAGNSPGETPGSSTREGSGGGNAGGASGENRGKAVGGNSGMNPGGSVGGGYGKNAGGSPAENAEGDSNALSDFANRRRLRSGKGSGSRNGSGSPQGNPDDEAASADPPEELPLNPDEPEPQPARSRASGHRPGDTAYDGTSGDDPNAGAPNKRQMSRQGGRQQQRRGPQGSNARGSATGDDSHLGQLARRHWGQSEPGATIGIEQDVSVRVDAEQMIVAEKHQLRYKPGETPTDLFLRLLETVDTEAQGWGKPKRGFYWTPRLRFVISPGGNQVFERLDPQVVKSGLSMTKDFTLNAAQPAKGEAQR